MYITDNNFILKNYQLLIPIVTVNPSYIFIYLDIHMINNYYIIVKSCIKNLIFITKFKKKRLLLFVFTAILLHYHSYAMILINLILN